MKYKLSLIASLFFAFPSLAETVINTDLVVVGAGGSGVTAAYAASLEGVKNVVILEKQPSIGGTANYSEGLFAADSHMQLERNIALSADESFKMIMDYSHWRANPKLVRAFVDKSSETIDWLSEQGIGFKEVTSNYPGGLQSWHIFDGRGKAVINNFSSKFEKMNIKLMTETPGKELIYEDGIVKGVIAENEADGETYRINAKAVIIATGGFLNNHEMMKKYTRYPDAIPVGNIGKTGDGINMMLGAGAALEGMEVVQSYRPGVKGEPTTSLILATSRQPYLWVNPQGERFTNEMAIFQWPYAGNALERIGGTMYTVYDAATRDYMINHGIDVGVGVMVPVKTKLIGLEKDLDRGIKKGIVFKGASIEDLANKMGIPSKNLENTIKQYNSFSKQKHDDEYVKDAKYIREVSKPPYYAVISHPTALGTLGGARVTPKMQVVDNNMQVIKGLYAAGNDAGGMYGDSYDLLMAGSTVGFAINSGRLSAEAAALYIKGEK
ncbi:FAD-dependent oxidoreductase [Shewanella sp. A14]